VWFQDEARIGQKNTLTRVWGQTGSRPAAPKDLGFASAYVFGAVCPSQGKAAALIMPICNTAAMNHHLCEISSQVAADAHAVVILDGASWPAIACACMYARVEGLSCEMRHGASCVTPAGGTHHRAIPARFPRPHPSRSMAVEMRR